MAEASILRLQLIATRHLLEMSLREFEIRHCYHRKVMGAVRLRIIEIPIFVGFREGGGWWDRFFRFSE